MVAVERREGVGGAISAGNYSRGTAVGPVLAQGDDDLPGTLDGGFFSPRQRRPRVGRQADGDATGQQG